MLKLLNKLYSPFLLSNYWVGQIWFQRTSKMIIIKIMALFRLLVMLAEINCLLWSHTQQSNPSRITYFRFSGGRGWEVGREIQKNNLHVKISYIEWHTDNICITNSKHSWLKEIFFPPSSLESWHGLLGDLVAAVSECRSWYGTREFQIYNLLATREVNSYQKCLIF